MHGTFTPDVWSASLGRSCTGYIRENLEQCVPWKLVGERAANLRGPRGLNKNETNP